MRRALVFLLSLILVACSGAAPERQRLGSGSRSSLTSSPKPTANSAGSARSETGGNKGATATKGGAKPSGLPSGRASHSTMPLTVSMVRCAERGENAAATVTTLKGSRLAFAVAYDDNTLPPDFTYIEGSANPTGTFTWRWLIRPNIPPGDALLTVVASKDSEGASYDFPFRIARAC